MTRLCGFTMLLCVALGPVVAATEHSVTGMVIAVDPAHRTFTASIDAIPGVMPAMVMPFQVRERKELEQLAPGAAVAFTLVVDATTSHAERVRVAKYQGVAPDPLAASRLELLTRLNGARIQQRVAVGDIVPEFRLIDQNTSHVALSDARGKVVVINFIYTTCALPNFCLRIANNFGLLQQRFRTRLGHDLLLLTVTFDPVHDTPDILAQYASRWNADPATWHFLTGPATDVMRVCHLFGVDAFPDEGLMNHSLHTAIIDREGRLVTNLEGNQFTARQLADLTQAVLEPRAQVQ
jgi:protein SCO1/2